MKRFTILSILLVLGILLVSPSLCFATPELEEGLVICNKPNVSPDGKQIVFTCNAAYGDIDVWIINIDGTGIKRLPTGPGTEWDPVFSPDGTRIVYTAGDDVWIMNVDGTEQKKLDKYPTWYSTCENFSPDGKKTAFIDGPGNIDNIYISNIDGTGRKQLTTGNYKDWNPSWSPDGTHVIFSSNRGYQPPEPEGEIWRIWRVNIGGTGLTQITEEPFDQPVYSPDGIKIAAVGKDGQIWIMNADGTNQRRLTDLTTIIKPVVPVKFAPDKWNIAWLKDKGRGEKEGHINCYIGRIEGDPTIGVESYEVDKIDIGFLELTVEIPVAETYALSPEGPSQILNSHPGFKGRVLKVKFNKFKAISTLQENENELKVGEDYEVLIRGKMKDGQDFSGKSTIQIIGKR